MKINFKHVENAICLQTFGYVLRVDTLDAEEDTMMELVATIMQ